MGLIKAEQSTTLNDLRKVRVDRVKSLLCLGQGRSVWTGLSHCCDLRKVSVDRVKSLL